MCPEARLADVNHEIIVRFHAGRDTAPHNNIKAASLLCRKPIIGFMGRK
jgi:hypothetical protein